MANRKIVAAFILAAMMLSLVPAVLPVNAVLGGIAIQNTDGTALGATSQKGDTISVIGTGVPAGYTVEVYWDNVLVTTWDGVKGKLNSTTAAAGGTFDCWITIPSATMGVHNIWVKAPQTSDAAQMVPITIAPKISVSPSTGVVGDKVTVSLYGFQKEKDLHWYLAQTAGVLGTAIAVDENLGTGLSVNAVLTYTRTLANIPAQPGTVDLLVNTVHVIDNAAGAFPVTDVDPGVGVLNLSGTINYLTGEISVTYAANPGAGLGQVVDAYRHLAYDDDIVAGANYYYDLGTLTTSTLGAASTSFTIPANPVAIPYTFQISVLTPSGMVLKAYTKGPSISVSPVSAAVGDIIRVNGRGYIAGENIAAIKLTRTGLNVNMIPNFPAAWGVGNLVVNGDGTWYADINVPQGNKVKDDYLVLVDASVSADKTTDFEVTALAEITVTPSHGLQGSTVTVSGKNFINIADVNVNIQINTAGAPVIGTVKTKSDGSWSKTVTIPANAAGVQVVTATDAKGIADGANFRAGNMGILLSDADGITGDEVTITGYGFTAGKKYNVTFGSTVLLKSSESVVIPVGGTINYAFHIPQVAAGAYTVTVWDDDSDISLTTTYTVSGVTQVTLSPSSAPNLYKVDVTGSGFYNTALGVGVTYKLYNKTSSGAMDKWFNVQILDDTTNLLARVNATGWINAYWNVDPKATLSKGSYFLEVKDAQGYIVTVPFTVGETHIVAISRKATYKPSETVSFNLEHSLGNIVAQPIDTSYLKVYNPSNVLVFQTAGNVAGDWVKVGDYYVLPYAKQLVGGNPMVLSDDAPTGTWTWKWYDANDDKIKEGTFEVSATGGTVSPEIAALTTDIANLKATVTGIETSVNAKVDAVKADVAAVKVDIAGVKTAVDTQVAALKTDITGVKSDVAALKTSVSADVAAVKTSLTTSLTAVSTDVTALKTSVAGVTTAVADTQKAVQSLAASVATVNTAVGGAKDAANAANAAVGGLQTLVYGAIGASLIAAAAAIVALMQISRKIA